jgi:hypothetical protein
MMVPKSFDNRAEIQVKISEAELVSAQIEQYRPAIHLSIGFRELPRMIRGMFRDPYVRQAHAVYLSVYYIVGSPDGRTLETG